ncbi:hypothetical protein P9246_10720 [Aeribacillus pallidus]|uniref:hypothetical protein n=1 Tax=Aeribacillus composti TaxID=1868734 RepID=UPI002E23FFD9|nr:hypothetical protein [Aeribacillus composti]MED4487214.1 hypothetical protein [Aeribacillus pallidus]
MKVYKVYGDGEVSTKICAEKEPYPHIPIGESGRGRKLTLFPVGARFAETLGDDRSIERASVIKTKQKGTLLLVEERTSEDRRALVHLAIEAGFRGGASWTGAEKVETPCLHRKSEINSVYFDKKEGGKRFCRTCGTEVKPIGFFNSAHPDEGTYMTYPSLENIEGVTVLAEGYCAQGDAGRMGGHPEYLVILEPGTLIRVKRTGRLYGAASELFVRWDGESLSVGTLDVLFPPVHEEEGELI